jgi:hypothetical protein
MEKWTVLCMLCLQVYLQMSKYEEVLESWDLCFSCWWHYESRLASDKWGLHFNDNTKSDVTNYRHLTQHYKNSYGWKTVCRRTGHTFQKYTQSHSVYKEQARDNGYKPLQLYDSLQTIYNSELKRLYHKSRAMRKYKQMSSNAAMCDIWWPVPSAISHKTENYNACQCHSVIFQCKKICVKDIWSW